MAADTFPRHVHRRGGVYRVCNDESTYRALKEAGWVDHPPADWPVPDQYQEWTPALDEPQPAPKKGRIKHLPGPPPPED